MKNDLKMISLIILVSSLIIGTQQVTCGTYTCGACNTVGSPAVAGTLCMNCLQTHFWTLISAEVTTVGSIASIAGTCTECPRAKFADTSATHIVTSCSLNCNVACTACTGTTNTACTKCARNFGGSGTTCTACGPGEVTADNVAPAICTACDTTKCAATFCFDVSTQCTKCAVSLSFIPALAANNTLSQCSVPCATGFGAAGATAADPSCKCNAPCATCETTSANACATCPINYKYDSTAKLCTPCDAGTYNAAGTTSATCSSCTNNCICLGDTTCIGCIANFRYNQTDKTCTACLTGYESTGGVGTSCSCTSASALNPTHPCFNSTAANPCSKNELKAGVVICTACIQGYTLNTVTNQCQFPVTTLCAPRNYFQFNKCLPVNPLCGEFDLYTGACKTCADSVNYTLTGGLCIRRVGTCTGSQVLINNACVDRQAQCQTFDSNNRCILCINATLYTLENGICKRIVLNCAARQYQVGLNCVNYPDGCFNFVEATERCLDCLRGYSNEQGVCKEITCPDRFFVNLSTNQCNPVNVDCQTYDPKSGDCQSCVDPALLPSEGRCIRGNTLAGCKFRQVQGFGPCELIPNCRVHNLITGDCDTCYVGFNEQNGNCVKKPVCNDKQEGFGSTCRAKPANCTKVNELSLCVQCISADFQIINGVCILLIKCAEGQYLNQVGNCLDANPGCDQVNPSNGRCVTCKQAGTSPSKGACCPKGQIFIGNGCVVIDVLVNPSDDGCQRRHPSTNSCLKCVNGLKIDPFVNQRCIPK